MSTLLEDLDRLPHSQRVARMARLGREAPEDLDRQLDELAASGWYGARLALVAARHGGRWGRLVQALDHPSRAVRHAAASLLPREPRAARAAATRLDSVPRVLRRRILDLVRRAGLAEEVLARGVDPASAARLLPGCSEETVRARLPELAPWVNWKWLALRHPGPTLDWIRADLEADPRAWGRYTKALEVLSLERAAEVLALPAEPDFLPPRFARLARRHPQEAFALLARPDFRRALGHRSVPPGVIRHLAPEQREAVAFWLLPRSPEALAGLLEELPPGQRGRVFEAGCRALDPSLQAWPGPLLETLPREVRDREAERMLRLRETQDSPRRRLEVLAFRRWEQARETLLEETRRAEAEDRATAWRLVVRCAGREGPEALAEAVRLVAERLRNEQDPVRLAAVAALAEVPPSRFPEEAAPSLEALAGDAFDARDASGGTLQALGRLAMGLVRQGRLMAAALSLLDREVDRTGSLPWGTLRNLPRAVEDRLMEVLAPRLPSLERLERHGLALQMAQDLGRRAWRHEGLQQAVGAAALRGQDWTARSAVTLWLEDPSQRDGRVGQLLEGDPSSVTLLPVWMHLHRKRQDLLPPFLDAPVLKGRFLTGETRWLAPVPASGLFRWAPAAQRTLAHHLDETAIDSERPMADRQRALLARGRLLESRAADLEPFAQSPEVAVAEAALQGMARLDHPAEALPTLLASLDGDRARVAAYALPSVLREVAPEEGLRVVRDLLERPGLKVTVEKEALRLLGSLRAPGAGAVLRERWNRPDLHRDLRIAVLHAARALRDDDAWWLLEQGAASEDRDVARAMLQLSPEAVSRADAERYVDLVLQVARHADRQVRRLAFEALPAWAGRAADPVARAAAEAVADLEAGSEWRPALAALSSAVRRGAVEPLEGLARQLARSDGRWEPEGERDLPALQRLLALVDSLTGLRAWERQGRAADLRRVAEALPPVEAARLRASLLDWSRPAAAAEGLAELAMDSEAHRPALAAVRAQVRKDLSGAPTGPGKLLPAADRLASAESAAARRLALEVVRHAGPAASWPAEWRQRLARLRQDEDPEVAEAARRVWVARE